MDFSQKTIVVLLKARIRSSVEEELSLASEACSVRMTLAVQSPFLRPQRNICLHSSLLGLTAPQTEPSQAVWMLEEYRRTVIGVAEFVL